MEAWWGLRSGLVLLLNNKTLREIRRRPHHTISLLHSRVRAYNGAMLTDETVNRFTSTAEARCVNCGKPKNSPPADWYCAKCSGHFTRSGMHSGKATRHDRRTN